MIISSHVLFDLKSTLISVKGILSDVILYTILALFLFILLCDLKDFFPMAFMVLRLYHSKKKADLIKHIKYLLKANPEFVDKVTNFDYIRTWYEHKLVDTVKKYTTVQQKEAEYGVKEKKRTPYYIDLQKACVEDESSLEILAFSIALLIVNEIGIYKSPSFFIVGQAGGNSILARRVASILGLRFVIVGSLAGKKDVVFGKHYPFEKAILVDDILFTGSMMIENLRTLKAHNIICDHIVVAIIRDLSYQKYLAGFCIENSCEIIVHKIHTYLDDDIKALIGQ